MQQWHQGYLPSIHIVFLYCWCVTTTDWLASCHCLGVPVGVHRVLILPQPGHHLTEASQRDVMVT